MDLIIIIGIYTLTAAIILNLAGRYWIEDRKVKKLKAESVRFEGEWQQFLADMKEAVEKKNSTKYERWVQED